MEPETLFTKAKDVGLTDAERATLSARIRALPRPVRSPYTFIHSRLLVQAMAAFLIIVVAGGSTALAASNALPGDVLFPVKIHVNEKVESLLAVTPEAQAQVAVLQATRRLDEAEELVHKGRLTETTTKEIEDNFTQKAAEVADHVQTLRKSHKEDDAQKVEDRFRERVDSHLKSFVELQKGEGSTTPGVQDVRDTIERHRESRSGSGKDDRKEEIRSTDSGKDGGDSNSGKDDSEDKVD